MQDVASSGGFFCLNDNGYSFYIGRVGTSDGSVDQTVLENMRNAWEAGESNMLIVLLLLLYCREFCNYEWANLRKKHKKEDLFRIRRGSRVYPAVPLTLLRLPPDSGE